MLKLQNKPGSMDQSATSKPSGDMNGTNASHAPLKLYHRSDFGRSVYRGPPVDRTRIKRDYLWSDEEFKKTLQKFNATIDDDRAHSEDVKGRYECVGYANVRLQFCSLCFDAEKEKRRELYYVNKQEIAHHRQNICHGCLGYKLRIFASGGRN